MEFSKIEKKELQELARDLINACNLKKYKNKEFRINGIVLTIGGYEK